MTKEALLEKIENLPAEKMMRAFAKLDRTVWLGDFKVA